MIDKKDELKLRIANLVKKELRVRLQKIARPLDRSPEANAQRAFPLDKREFAFFDEDFSHIGDEMEKVPPVRVESFYKTPESDKRMKDIHRPVNRKRGSNYNLGSSPLSDVLEDKRVNRELFKKRGSRSTDNPFDDDVETFSEMFMRKFGPKGIVGPAGREIKVDRFSQGTISLENARKLAKLKQRLAYQPARPQGIVTKHKVRMNPEHGQTIADAYDAMKHDPTNPDVKASYDAFKQETKNQFNELQKGGLKVTKLRPDQPGYTTASQMHRDIQSGNLNYFPSEQGFGTGSVLDHPLLEGSGIYDQEGKEIPYNDLFRIVHDVNGHKLSHSDFSPEGEHAAFLTHRQQYSPLAQGALFTETAGQANWGAYNRRSGAKNRDLITAGKFNELEFAEQKAGLLPREIIEGNWHG